MEVRSKLKSLTKTRIVLPRNFQNKNEDGSYQHYLGKYSPFHFDRIKIKAQISELSAIPSREDKMSN